MKKNLNVILLLAILLIAGGFVWFRPFKIASSGLAQTINTGKVDNTDSPFINNNISLIINAKEKRNSKPDTVFEQKDTIPSNWKTYSNNELGISFQVPPTWIKYGNESNAVNRSGVVMARMVNFIDTVSKSVFYLEYHLAPYGGELYKYDKAQIASLNDENKKEGKQVSVAGNKATETFNIMSSDIKGTIYDPPIKFAHVFLLDKQQTGEFDLHFRTLLPVSDSEIAKFERVLSTIKLRNPVNQNLP